MRPLLARAGAGASGSRVSHEPRIVRAGHRRGALTVSPIGIVRSACRERRAMPGEGVRARIEVTPAYRSQLAGIELSSHLIVLGWFDTVWPDRGEPLLNDPHAPPRGVFATRSPRRPNRISLTVVRVIDVGKGFVEVDGLDLVDGTPVLDLKPYIPGQDAVFSATRTFRSRSRAAADRLAGYLAAELRNHLGDHAREPDAKEALGAVLAAYEAFGVDPRDPRLRACVSRASAAADALMAMLGATLVSGRVVIEPRDGPLRITLSLEGRSLEIVAPARTGVSGDLLDEPA